MATSIALGVPSDEALASMLPSHAASPRVRALVHALGAPSKAVRAKALADVLTVVARDLARLELFSPLADGGAR